MALVAYDNSDSEFEEDEENVITHISTDLGSSEPHPSDMQESDVDRSIFHRLPQPCNERKEIVEEEDEFLFKKESPSDVKPRSKITIPSLNDFKDVKHIVPSIKPKTSNGKKSGLLSILPQPKNAVKVVTKSLIPSIVSQRPPVVTTVKKKVPLPSLEKIKKTEPKSSLLTEYSDESDNDDIQNDFFSFNKLVSLPTEDISLTLDKEPTSTIEKAPRTVESYFKKDMDHVELETDDIQPSNSNDDYSLNVDNRITDDSTKEVMLDEEAIMKLCGARAKRKREDIQIVDVNQEEVLGDAREWLLKGLMDDTTKRQSASKKRGNEPTSQQKRKHQITYLAHQAKANEAELQNQWANNRMTKRRTQSKYGF